MKKRTLLITGVIILAFIITFGSLFIKWPQETRYVIHMMPYAFVIKNDVDRVHDLQRLKSEIVNNTRRTGILPESLDEIGFGGESEKRMHDKQMYTYATTSIHDSSFPTKWRPAFQLCATFQSPSPLFKKDITPPCHGTCPLSIQMHVSNPLEPQNQNFEFWGHGKGLACWIFKPDGTSGSGTNIEPF
jgi:hypothetical protein